MSVHRPELFWSWLSYIRPYHPFFLRFASKRFKIKNPAFDSKTDGPTLQLKEGKWLGVKSAIPEFSTALAELAVAPGALLVLVPGHLARHSNAGTAMGRVLDGIIMAHRGVYIDGKDLLIRRVTVPRKSEGGPRNLQTEFDSIRVDTQRLRDHRRTAAATTLIILDDIATTGLSISACRTLLARTAPPPVRIGALVLGKTV